MSGAEPMAVNYMRQRLLNGFTYILIHGKTGGLLLLMAAMGFSTGAKTANRQSRSETKSQMLSKILNEQLELDQQLHREAREQQELVEKSVVNPNKDERSPESRLRHAHVE